MAEKTLTKLLEVIRSEEVKKDIQGGQIGLDWDHYHDIYIYIIIYKLYLYFSSSIITDHTKRDSQFNGGQHTNIMLLCRN